MNPRAYYLVSGGIFGFVAFMHLLRVVNHSVCILGSWHVPMFFSWLAVAGAGFLSYQGFLLAGVIKKK